VHLLTLRSHPAHAFQSAAERGIRAPLLPNETGWSAVDFPITPIRAQDDIAEWGFSSKVPNLTGHEPEGRVGSRGGVMRAVFLRTPKVFG
jgi:hypothetical protein